MNEKEFFKEVLKDDMPDLEKVRRNCINSLPQKQKSNFTIWSKRLAPVALCAIIVVVSIVVSGNAKDLNNAIISNGKTQETTRIADNTKKKPNKEKTTSSDLQGENNHQNNDKGDKNKQDVTNIEETTVMGQDEVITGVYNGKIYYSSIKTSDNFASLEEFVEKVKSYQVYEDRVISVNEENNYNLNVSPENLSMILDEKVIYEPQLTNGYILNSGSINSNETYGCCTLNVSGEVSITLEYSTCKVSATNQYADTIQNDNGLSIGTNNEVDYTWEQDGYLFSATLGSKNTIDNIKAVKSFLKGISFKKVSLY